MQCVPGVANLPEGELYQNKAPLTRPYSLPYIFRKLRIHHGLLESSVAVKCDVDLSYVESFEAGHLVPSLKFCLAYADLFGFNPNWVKVKWAHWVSNDFKDKLLEGLGLDY